MASRGLLGWVSKILTGDPPPAESLPGNWKELQNRVERLELDNAERQVTVLNAVEKTLHQLRARDAKRPRGGDEDDRGADGAAAPEREVSLAASTAHLSRRFRRL